MKSFVLALILLFHASSFAREIALTFDDCPRKAGPVLKPMERDRKLVGALKAAGITAAFFCNSPGREAQGLERIKFFAANGHLIANHSADHPDLYRTPVDQFIGNIDQADLELRSLPNFRKWFRFPYLHEGKDQRDVEAVRLHLKKIGYINGYVTVDTEDWYADEVLRQKLNAGKSYDEKRLCRTYSQMMADDADHFDDMSVKVFGRSVKHVILLHETDLNAICLPELIRELKSKKWTFVSPDEAYGDPIASTEPLSTTKLNNGRVSALATEAGYKGPFYTKWKDEAEIEKQLERKGAWK